MNEGKCLLLKSLKPLGGEPPREEKAQAEYKIKS